MHGFYFVRLACQAFDEQRTQPDVVINEENAMGCLRKTILQLDRTTPELTNPYSLQNFIQLHQSSSQTFRRRVEIVFVDSFLAAFRRYRKTREQGAPL
jgi:hypothetical protein